MHTVARYCAEHIHCWRVQSLGRWMHGVSPTGLPAVLLHRNRLTFFDASSQRYVIRTRHGTGSLGHRVSGSFGSSFTSGSPGHHFDPAWDASFSSFRKMPKMQNVHLKCCQTNYLMQNLYRTNLFTKFSRYCEAARRTGPSAAIDTCIHSCITQM